jgi:CheY-like chemotaxis protein
MPATQRTVLVVDDDPYVRSILTLLLSGEGFAVAAAADGREGLAHLRQAGPRPRLVVLDLSMPRMDGWQFLRERALDAGLAAVPVLVLSSEPNAQETLALGAAEVLAKPFGLQALADVVRKHCGTPPPLA